MSADESSSPPSRPAPVRRPSARPDDRRDRLAKALKANLRRRKTAATHPAPKQ